MNFCAQYALVANDDVLAKMLDNVTEMTSPDKREMAESARSAVETALKIPGAKVVLSFRGVVVPVCTLFLFLTVFAIPCTILAGRKGFFREFALQSSLLTGIPTLGFIVNLGVRLAYLDPRLTLGPSLLIKVADHGSFVGTLLNQLDLFTLWYLIALSVNCSRRTSEGFAVFVVAAAGCWIGLILASYLAGFPFVLMP
jgi:hypothetical protein